MRLPRAYWPPAHPAIPGSVFRPPFPFVIKGLFIDFMNVLRVCAVYASLCVMLFVCVYSTDFVSWMLHIWTQQKPLKFSSLGFFFNRGGDLNSFIWLSLLLLLLHWVCLDASCQRLYVYSVFGGFTCFARAVLRCSIAEALRVLRVRRLYVCSVSEVLRILHGLCFEALLFYMFEVMIFGC